MSMMQTLMSFFKPGRRSLSPADFRRNKIHAGKNIGIDPNSKHIGSFSGDIVPMKRRFRGVSRTAHK